MSRANGEAGERVLVRLPNWLGDVMLARPLLHALRRSRPRDAVAGVAPGPLLELLEADGVLDAAHAWPADGEARRRLVSTLRAWRADAALVLPPSWSSAWFARSVGARVRVGYAHEGRGWLLTHRLSRGPRGDRHLAAEYLELGRAIEVEPGPTPPLALPERAARAAEAFLTRLGLASRPLAVLGPGARYGPAKRWPEERFAAVARFLGERGLSVLVSGAADEADVCTRVAERAGEATSIAGATSLLELAGLCARARLSVCNDSGLAHLCAALGAPTVAVFGSTSSSWTAPVGERVRVLQRPPVCSPCFQRTCRIGYGCLTAVSEASVRATCEALLGADAA